jgi:putative peptidoglycan lipid II flippase
LAVLGDPIISLIYERGRFSAFDTNMTAWALAAYALGLAGYAAVKVLSPAFYALDDAKTPMYISLTSILIHVPASFGMMQLLSTVGVSPERPNGFGHVGVALATSIVATVNVLALTWFMRRRIDRIDGREIGSATIRIVIASVAMSATAYFAYRLLADHFASEVFVVRLIEVFVPIAVGMITFLIAAKILRISEVEKIYGALKRKFSR